MFDSVDHSAGLGMLRKNQSSEDLLREAQVRRKLEPLHSIWQGLLHSFWYIAARTLFEKSLGLVLKDYF